MYSSMQYNIAPTPIRIANLPVRCETAAKLGLSVGRGLGHCCFFMC